MRLNIRTVHRSIYDHQHHPKALQPVLPEIRTFAEHNHVNVLLPVLRLLALGMELPEETFVNTHGFDAKGETYGKRLIGRIAFLLIR